MDAPTKERAGVNVPLAQRLIQMEPRDFHEWVDNTLDVLHKVTDLLKNEVKDTRIAPIQAAGVIACSAGQLFGYQEFHGQTNAIDLYALSNSAAWGDGGQVGGGGERGSSR